MPLTVSQGSGRDPAAQGTQGYEGHGRLRPPDSGADQERRDSREGGRDAHRMCRRSKRRLSPRRVSSGWTPSAASPRSPAIWSGASGTEPRCLRGRFITIEGGEGAGKTTQVGLLVAALERAGIPARATREPGGSPGGEAIRRLLLEGDGERWDAVGEALLLVAARRDHVTRLIAPALAQGIWVVSDRFADSTLAYQGYGRGLALDDLAALHRFALGDFAPDLTVILDLPVEIGLARAAARPGRRPVRAPRPDFPRKAAPGLSADRRDGSAPLRPDRRVRAIRRQCTAQCSMRSSNVWAWRCTGRVARGVEAGLEATAWVPAPRANPDLVGHETAERELRRLVEARPAAARDPVVWAARHRQGDARLPSRPLSAGRTRPSDRPAAGQGLAIDPESGVFRRVAAGGHADLLTVERAYDPRRRRLRSEIVVEDAREITAFFRLTRGRRWVAHRHRRRGRGDEPQRGQRSS